MGRGPDRSPFLSPRIARDAEPTGVPRLSSGVSRSVPRVRRSIRQAWRRHSRLSVVRAWQLATPVRSGSTCRDARAFPVAAFGSAAPHSNLYSCPHGSSAPAIRCKYSSRRSVPGTRGLLVVRVHVLAKRRDLDIVGKSPVAAFFERLRREPTRSRSRRRRARELGLATAGAVASTLVPPRQSRAHVVGRYNGRCVMPRLLQR